ncbi:DUF262 domain-containing HNH endonuclease family protein [Roseofilum reptotaenium CS-1145]|nr:DUF262 domain-containing HNH endonuclease family protein [Roseofilum reptotaenium CS-1145]
MSIKQLFDAFYSVPDFQREYVWQENEVQKLLQDLFEGLGLEEGESNKLEYFLGSIVVYPDYTDDIPTFQLIDGQQRLTTIYLIFCVLRDCIQEFGSSSKSIESYLQGTTQNMDTGEDVDRPRLCLQYDTHGKKVLDEYLLHSRVPEKELLKSSASANNIFKAWKLINNFFSEHLEKELTIYRKASTAIANKTKLIRIETPDLKNALKVFETINDRGVGLTPVDLLKNYLFIHTSREIDRNRHWQTLTNKWEEFLKKIYQSKQKPLTFLRYYLMASYDVELSNSFPEEEIYEWFLKHGTTEGIDRDPIKFLDDLILAADHYGKLTQGKNPDGSDNIHLKGISKIQGRFKSHLVLSLAGRFLEKSIFEKFSYYIENLSFVISVTKKTRQKDFNITRQFAYWSKKVRTIKNYDDMDDFVEENIVPQLQEVKEEFYHCLIQMSQKSLAIYRLRYLLAKIAQYVEKQTYGHSESLDFYLDKQITIEHILPQSTKLSSVHKLGNLTLLEKTINSSVSNKSYQEKLLGYRNSRIVITRSLAEKLNVGHDTQINRALEDLRLTEFRLWNDESIEKRQKILADIAMKVWGLDNL